MAAVPAVRAKKEVKREAAVRRICFTLNNYTPEEFLALQVFSVTYAKFAVIGKEVGDNGTPSSGFFNLKKRTRFSALKKVMPRAHLEIAVGTDEENLVYCTKQDTEAFRTGKPVASGDRTDLEIFKESVKAGCSYDQSLEDHSEICARYPRFAKKNIVPKLFATQFRLF